jgi:hypothetical protein
MSLHEGCHRKQIKDASTPEKVPCKGSGLSY